jgi:hypothetical protein
MGQVTGLASHPLKSIEMPDRSGRSDGYSGQSTLVCVPHTVGSAEMSIDQAVDFIPGRNSHSSPIQRFAFAFDPV